MNLKVILMNKKHKNTIKLSTKRRKNRFKNQFKKILIDIILKSSMIQMQSLEIIKIMKIILLMISIKNTKLKILHIIKNKTL